MLNALLLSLTTVGISAQAILKKAYNGKTGRRGVFAFCAISVLFAAFFFLAAGGFRLDFAWEVVPYSLGFSLAFGVTLVMSVLAIKLGSLSLTSLISSYSLVIPTFYGLFFLGEQAGSFFYPGLLLLGISLFLINGKCMADGRITLPWMAAAFLTFLGNGVCSTVQTVQQKTFHGQYKSEMMTLALLIVAISVGALSLVFERKDIARAAKRGGAFAAACGLINGGSNLLVMLLAVRMNASIMFPVLSAGGILLTGAVSIFFYKERLAKRQYAALILGTASVVLMNLP